ncbi:MAG: hypothetical protein LBG62_05675 [Candidatus Methanoplasma sp.]|jgi:hypothetical protein|nr:hypothetical protein [Candidatus Methanoplasma sp.]
MSAAIICPKHPIDRKLIRQIASAAGGRVFETMGDEDVDYGGFEKAVLVYMLPMGPASEAFLGCLEDAMERFGEVSCVICAPYEYDWDGEAADACLESVGRLASEISGRLGAKGISVVQTERLQIKVQRSLAVRLGYEWANALDRKALSGGRIAIAFYERAEISAGKRPVAYLAMIAAGIALIMAGFAMMFAFVTTWSDRPQRSGGALVLGTGLVIEGYRKYATSRWVRSNERKDK